MDKDEIIELLLTRKLNAKKNHQLIYNINEDDIEYIKSFINNADSILNYYNNKFTYENIIFDFKLISFRKMLEFLHQKFDSIYNNNNIYSDCQDFIKLCQKNNCHIQLHLFNIACLNNEEKSFLKTLLFSNQENFIIEIYIKDYSEFGNYFILNGVILNIKDNYKIIKNNERDDNNGKKLRRSL